MQLEEFEQTCACLAAADSVLLVKFLSHFGYDYWLQRQAFLTGINPKQISCFSTSLIEKFKEFVEVDFCQSQ